MPPPLLVPVLEATVLASIVTVPLPLLRMPPPIKAVCEFDRAGRHDRQVSAIVDMDAATATAASRIGRNRAGGDGHAAPAAKDAAASVVVLEATVLAEIVTVEFRL